MPLTRLAVVSAALLGFALRASAAPSCEEVLARLSDRLADATCTPSPDLTTNNTNTTPGNNSIPGLPAGAFTPLTDRTVIAPSDAFRPPPAHAVPGLQIEARFADDPTGQGRFLLRLPNDWNGRLVVAGASGTRSEFNGDFAWSDYVLPQGYAYASQNKGVLNLSIASLASATPPNPLACRLNPISKVWVNFYDNDDGQPFTRWATFMAKAAETAREGVKAAYHRGPPRYTYAVGTSNGGYQVRRAVESYPELFDGGVDWEGTFVDAGAPNLLTDLPAGVLNFTEYAADPDANGTAAKNILAAGYPPDIVLSPTTTLWTSYWAQFWEVTQCQWQKRLDPGYDTYGSGTATYRYVARLSASNVGAELAAFATTGRIQRPLVTVAGTMDGLLPIDHHARAYARRVAEWQAEGGRPRPAYRLWEVQNGNHIETFKDAFAPLELIQPHARRAFDLLVRHVEDGAALPPDQCVPRGGSVEASPSQPGHCTDLFVP